MRDFGALAVGDLPDGFAGSRDDVFTVERKGNAVEHRLILIQPGRAT
jgi:hypothetical protein